MPCTHVGEAREAPPGVPRTQSEHDMFGELLDILCESNGNDSFDVVQFLLDFRERRRLGHKQFVRYLEGILRIHPRRRPSAGPSSSFRATPENPATGVASRAMPVHPGDGLDYLPILTPNGWELYEFTGLRTSQGST
nr:MAG: hypothetical protein [Aspergillus flavus narnavirus 1]